jgi:hypothetical protein
MPDTGDLEEEKTMYGYAYPRKPELGILRVRVSPSQLQEYQRAFPRLSRDCILDTMIAKGPLRSTVEAELRRLATEATCSHA